MGSLRNRNCDSGEIVVSIICNTFNHSKSVKRALDSFLDQNVCFDVEILVHDDCSTDGTVEIIEEYKKKYPNIIKPMYENENQYSKGIDILKIQSNRLKGKYVAICEGDDYWCDNDKLMKQVHMIEKTKNKICLHKVRKCDSLTEKQIGHLPDFELSTGTIKTTDFLKIILDRYSFQTSSYMLAADEFKKMYLDYPKFIQLLPTGDEAILLYFSTVSNVDYIDESMSTYTLMNVGSWSNKHSKLSNKEISKHKKECYRAYKEFDKYTNKKYHAILSKRIHDSKWSYLYLNRRYLSLFFYDPRSVLYFIKQYLKK